MIGAKIRNYSEYASGLSFHKACGGGNDKDERISEQTKYYKKNFQKEIRLGGKWGNSFGIGGKSPGKQRGHLENGMT